LAASLFPETDRENPFFVQGPRKIFAHLLNLKPTPEELLGWLSDEHELERRLKGTPLAAMVYENAGPQRGGMFGALSMVADSLKLLPSPVKVQSVKKSWTAAEWSGHRQGWVFVTSIPEAREQLRPLISMWLDMMILRLMNQGRRGPRPVWFVLDELSSLHRLPQLLTAITENRKAGNPVVLCFQGRSQLEAIYGHAAEAMFSQPATKIFLKTSEPRAAQWISDTIGEMEIERLTAPSKELHVANRELGTIARLDERGDIAIHTDSGRLVEFHLKDHPHLDYGYAVTSHSSQGQTADRVLVHADTEESVHLVNSRMAYVAVSRGRYDAQIYTNNKSELAGAFESRCFAPHGH
jgi:hypothetical protein